MSFLLINLLCALAWVALTGEFTPVNFIIGFALGYMVLRLTVRSEVSSKYFKKGPQLIGFAFYFAWEVVKANLQVAYEVVTPGNQMTPGIVAIPLDAKTDAEITMLANLITLTPGTLSLEVSADRRTLFVHALYIEDVERFKANIKSGLERRLLEVMR